MREPVPPRPPLSFRLALEQRCQLFIVPCRSPESSLGFWELAVLHQRSMVLVDTPKSWATSRLLMSLSAIVQLIVWTLIFETTENLGMLIIAFSVPPIVR